MWQLPQIFLLAVGEVLVSVTGMEFSYSQVLLMANNVMNTENNVIF